MLPLAAKCIGNVGEQTIYYWNSNALKNKHDWAWHAGHRFVVFGTMTATYNAANTNTSRKFSTHVCSIIDYSYNPLIEMLSICNW